MPLFSFDLRWLTGSCLCLIGFALVSLAFKVWWMPLHRRAVLFEPYLKERGVRTLLDSWPLVFVFGTCLIATGISKWAYYLSGNGGAEVASGIGLLEAIFSIWAAGSVTVVAVRAWRES